MNMFEELQQLNCWSCITLPLPTLAHFPPRILHDP